jgi:hypothetical protein
MPGQTLPWYGGGGGGGGGPRTRGPLRAREVHQIELRERGVVEGSAHAQPQHGVRAARVGVDGVGAGPPPRRAATARLLRVALRREQHLRQARNLELSPPILQRAELPAWPMRGAAAAAAASY